MDVAKIDTYLTFCFIQSYSVDLSHFVAAKLISQIKKKKNECANASLEVTVFRGVRLCILINTRVVEVRAALSIFGEGD